jgi:hypothetical protein
MLVVIAAVVLISIASYFATTTREQRAAIQADYNRRWNKVWWTVLLAELALVVWLARS